MIYTSVNVKINSNGTATSSNKVVLYRGDREVEIQMALTGNPYIIKESTFAQLIIRRDNATPIITGIAPLKDSKVILTITEENIDELTEVGSYAYQIRLYDDDMSARITLPPVENGLEVREPIVDEASGAIGRAMINYSLISRATIDENSTFNEYDEYNKTTWRDGDYITDVKMNKIEDALYVINQRVLSNAESAYISTDMQEDQKVGVGESLDISFEFISPNKGKGTLKVSVNGIQKMTQYVEQEELITINLPEEYFSKGDNKVTLYVVDRAGKSSNELIFMVRYGSTELTPDFDQYTAYQYGASVRYYFIPSCLDTSSKLLFHMEIDGTPKEPMECTSDVRGYYTFPNNLSVGAHHCKAYLIDAQGNRSNEVIFNLIIIDAYSIVIASDTKNPVVEEGAQLVLDYKIYMEHADTFITKVYIDDVLVSSGECGLETAYYRNSSLKEGNHIIRIEAWDKAETISDYVVWNVTVTESMFARIEPATAGAIFLASASDHSNSDQNRDKWVGVDQDGNEVVAQLENFTFDSESGWVDNELIFGGVAKAVVPIKPLANNARYGFTLDLEFTSTEIGAEGALVLDLWDYTKDCGIKITTEKLRLRSAEGNEASLYFEDSTNTSVIFVIDRNEKKAKIYLNGVMCSAFNLSDYESNGKWVLEDFTVDDYIRLGGKGASRIRNLRVYQVALTTNEIINNFISNKQSKDEQKELVEFQKGLHLPTLTIYCDFSGLGKDDKKPCKIVYSSTDEEKYGKSFELDHKESSVQYQGTSSMAYPIKNYRINLRDENGNKLYYDFPFGQPECRFTLKADFMSSGHWQNTGLTKWINDNLYNYNEKDEKSMNPKKWFDLQNGGSIDDTRECIYGFPCRLILVNDGNTPLNAGQNEPTPGNTKDMGIFNFNHDKDATDTLGFDKDNFPNCMGFEVTANSDTSAGAFMRYTGGGTQEDELEYYKQSFELRFPDEDDVEPWYGFLGINAGTMVTDFYKQGDDYSTSYWEWDIFNTALHISSDKTIKSIECYYYDELLINMAVNATDKNITLVDGTNKIRFIFDDKPEYFHINDTKYILGNELSELSLINPYLGEEISPEYGIKRLVEWVDTCSDEEFVRDFEQYFHKDYTLRYYLLVITLGMVDNLGKNMMLDSWDGKIFMPRFYDCDTICSYDNTGDIVFDVDIEMAQGYWNTSSSRLWTRIRDLMHPELVAKYNNMRQNGLSYESLMRCFYDEQIAKIPQKYYNMDYDVKYAPFGDSYMGMAHGDGYEHLKRWLKKRILFVDSLFDYAPSYTSDMLTIRANTTETMSLTIETYDPQYVHVSWYNGQMDKIKVDGKTPVTFTGRAMAATDQEVLIYGGTNIKKLSGISTMNPGELIIGAATRLAELDASDCPILTQINLNKANLSAHPQLIKLNISNCPMLGGNLRIDNSKLLQELNIENTAISGINFPPKMRNLTILKVGGTNITSLDLSCWDTSNVTDMSNMFYDCINLTSLDVSGWNTSNVTSMRSMFYNCCNLTSLDLSGFDTSEVTTMRSMFNSCKNLTSLNLSGWDTSKVISMYSMFADCNSLTSIDVSGFDTSEVTDMNGMFSNCRSLTSLDVSNFNTSKVVIMNAMFNNCRGLTSLDVSGFDTSKVTDTNSMFNGCIKITSLDLSGWDTSMVTNMNSMFCNCYNLTNLNVSGLDTSKVVNMNSMFYGCNKLTSLNLSSWDTSYAMYMASMFQNCSKLTSLDVSGFKTSKVTNMSGMFDSCSSLTKLNVSGFDTSKVTNMEAMFRNCESLTRLDLSEFDLSSVTNMDYMFDDCISLTSLNVTMWPSNDITQSPISGLPVGDDDKNDVIASEMFTVPTGWTLVYNNPYDIAIYTCSTSGVLPKFNDEYTGYSVTETNNGDGTYTTCIRTNDLDIMPTKMSFDQGIYPDTRLLRVDKLSTTNIVDADCMFRNNTALEYVNLSGVKTSNVIVMSGMFAGCSGLTSLDVSSFDTSKVTDMTNMFFGCATLTSLDVSGFKTSAVTSMSNMFSGCSELTSLDVSGFDTSKVKNMSNMFRDCTSLTSLDVSGFDTSKVTDMSYMFQYCTKLTSIDVSGFKTSEVTNMTSMFTGCGNLTNLDVSGFKTSEVTAMSNMFQYCTKLTSLDVSGFKTSKVTNMAAMFSNCSSLTNLDVSGFDTSKVTDMANMFYYCRNLTNIKGIEDWDTSNVAKINSMFQYCYSLTSLNVSGFKTSKVTSMSSMFYGCENLTSLDVSGFDTSEVTNMYCMFYYCHNLTSLDVSAFDTSKVTDMSMMFGGCNSLTSLNIMMWPLNDTTQSAINDLPVGDDDKSEIIASSYFVMPTGWTLVYNNPYDIAIYTCNASGVLPTFNEEYIEYSSEETNNVDGTYTICIRTNDLDVMPTKMSFDQGATSNTRLLRIDKLSASNINNAEYMFRGNRALEYVNLSEFKTSNVTTMYGMFYGCNSLTNLDVSGFDTSKVTTMSNMFYDCYKLTNLDVSGFKTSEVTSMGAMFQYCSGLTNLDLSDWDTSNVTDMSSMFYSCRGLTSLDVSAFKTSEVTNMNSMFNNCSGLTTLDLSGFDTSKVANMGAMFSGCSKLTNLDVSDFDTSKVTTMSDMFRSCATLTSLDLSDFKTSNVIYMSNMFNSCSKLTNLDLSSFTTSKVKNMEYMFYSCTNLISLDLSSFDTSSVTTMVSMFDNCTNLADLDVSGFDTSNVTSMGYMFYNCGRLTSLDVSGFKTSNVTSMNKTFQYCTGLTSLDLSGWDTSKVISMGSMFQNCGSLTSLNVMMWPLNDMTQSAISTLPVGDDYKNEIIASERFSMPTGWTLVYSNPYDIVIYTCRESGLLPKFNSEYTGYSVIETNNGDGTYTTYIRTNDLEVMPTKMSFDQGATSNTRLLRVDKLITTNVTDMTYMFRNNTALEYVNSSEFKTSNVTNMAGMFNNCKQLTNLDVSGFKTSNVTSMYNMFYGCNNLTSLDLSGWDTSKVTNMANMFRDCKQLTNPEGIEGWDTSSVANMSYMFYNCGRLTSLNLSDFVTSEVNNMTGMFYNCSGLTSLDVSGFKTSEVTNMTSMFFGCSNLSSLDLSDFVTSEVTNMASMFDGCTNLVSLGLSGWVTSKVTNMSLMFNNCFNLTSLDVSSFKTSNVATMSSMFDSCNKLTRLDVSGFDTSKVTNMEAMFRNCESLTSLDVSGFDTSKVTNMDYMFDDCISLTSLNVTMWPLNDITQSPISGLPVGDDFKNEIIASEYFSTPTGWTLVYNNPYDITIYTCSTSGLLPKFNDEYTGYSVKETNNGDGTYTTCIRTNDLEIMPTKMSFTQGLMSATRSSLLRVDKLSATNIVDANSMFENNVYLEYVNLSEFKTSNVTSMASMFNQCSSLITIEGIEDWNTSEVTNMYCMFNNCRSLTSLDVSAFDTSKVTSMSDMFTNCSKLTNLDVSGFNTSEVTSMNRMFRDCTSLTSLDVSGFKTSKVSNMVDMFNSCNCLTNLDLSDWDTSNVTNMNNMFYNCFNLTNLDVSGFKTSKVDNMSGMFYGCGKVTSLDVSGFDTSKVTDMDYMFRNCTSLTSLDVSGFDTSEVTNMKFMFYNCRGLTSLDVSGFNTSKVTDMDYMFGNCYGLTSLNIMTWPLNDTTQSIINTLPVGDDVKNEIFASDYFIMPTGWTLMYDILIYTCNASGVLPTFNEEYIEYSSEETNNGDGTYTTRIRPSGLNIMATKISFDQGSRSNTKLLRVDRLTAPAIVNAEYMFRNNAALEYVNLSGVNTSKVTNMSGMFEGCKGLTSLDVSGFDTSEVTNMSKMFHSCESLTNLNLSSFDTSKVTDMNNMFYACKQLTSLDLSGFKTSNVTAMNSMFASSTNLTNLDVSGWDTSKVTTMQIMFYYCTKIKSIKGIEDWDTSEVTSMGSMFSFCSSVTSLDLSGWDTSKVTTMSSIFRSCEKLASLDSMTNISTDLDLSATSLDASSLVDVINNLSTISTTKSLTLGTKLIAKLTNAQIAAATNKGWTVS